MFESGRPVLLLLGSVPETLGERVAIAWNGSTETATAIALTMLLLQQEQSVFVITVEGGTVPGPKGRQVAMLLIRNGITATAHDVNGCSAAVGEAILNEAERLEADLLIEDAYTYNWLRQMIFGGATRDMLESAELPVLFADQLRCG